MNRNRFTIACCAIFLVSAGTAMAGPCDTSQAAKMKDAGAGPTVGSTARTTGANTGTDQQHPPTSTMNRATGDTATSSQDAQGQMQGQPTAAQQADGAKPSAKMAGQDC
jgi:hypothetical protein